MLKGMESFDIYETAQINQYFGGAGPGSIEAGAGRCGTAAWHGTAAAGSGPFIGVTDGSIDSGYAAMAYKPVGFNVNANFSIISPDNGFPVLFIRVLSSGAVDLWKGVNTIIGDFLATTPAGLLSIGTYTHIGVEWKHGASGYLRVYINGLLAADSGIVNTFTSFSGGTWSSIAFDPEGWIDDLYWGDASGAAPWNAFFGDCHVEGQVARTDAASGGGTYKEWAPSTGTDHGALVDEIPPDDGATYVSSPTAGETDTFKFPAIVPLTGPVYAIQLMPNMLKTQFETRTICNCVVSGGTLVTGVTQALAATSFKYYPQIYGPNPVTGAPWTVATANTMEGGVQVVA
jgi:hypothetical protein